ncbi:MAG: hypothetical protein D6811_05325 [Alphaproteobacteria bacterium]|nr:MAG: hypothetical protein D6811_05325 [Alphaproteobacteria bacterium]
MRRAWNRFSRFAARLRREEAGTASIEFVVMFPLLILLMATGFEAGLYSTRQALLDYAVEKSVRVLRLNPDDPPSYSEMVDIVCDAAVMVPDCHNAIQVELTPIDTETWDIDPGPVYCRDRENDYTPEIVFDEAGGGNRLMLLRLCAVFHPVFPTLGLGARLTRVSENDYAMVATQIFVTEPTE